MTKNLFLLFVLYFFVVQALFLGLLTGDSLYYKLGGINAVAILLIVFLYSILTTENGDTPKTKKADRPTPSAAKEESSHTEEPSPKHYEKATSVAIESTSTKEPLNEKGGMQKVVQVAPTPKKRRKKAASGQWWILLITLLIALALHFIVSEFLTYWSPLISLLVGCFAFFVIGKVFDIRGFNRARTLFTTRIYVFLLLLAIAYAGLYRLGRGDMVEKYLPTLWQVSFPLTGDKDTSIVKEEYPDADQGGFSRGDGVYIYEGTGQLITGSQGNTPLSEGTGMDVTTGTIANTGTEETVATTGNIISTTGGATGTAVKNITMIDALKHVIDTNTIPLSTKTDINFTMVNKGTTDYAYFKTAYEKRMIGKSTDPSKQISCETYIVIKGLGENWQVGNYTDIKAAYRSKAEELDALNGCVEGGRVTSATL